MKLETLNPEYRFSSLAKITPEWIIEHHFRALLLDIDNTLLPRNSTVIPEEHIYWLQKMQRQGIAIVFASNNGGKRTAAIENQMREKGLHFPILTWAGKPFPWAYAGAIRLLEGFRTPKNADVEKWEDKILVAGDQLFTDVLGAHWHNLPVAWLRPLSTNDFIGTKMLRVLEKCTEQYLAKKGILPEEDKADAD